MQIVIDISEEIIKDAKESPNYYPSYLFGTIWKSIGNGTVLPKHGRLKDVDEILDKLLYMGYMDEQKSEIEDVIEMLPTILEATEGDTE